MRIIKNKERINKENAELRQRVSALEEKMEGLTFAIKEISNGIYEVEKKEDSELPYGDYTNPIKITEEGLTTQKGLFYFVDDKDLPHEAVEDAFVTSEDFWDKMWFDWV